MRSTKASMRHLVIISLLVSSIAASCDHIKLGVCECKHPSGDLYEIHCQRASLKAMPPKTNKTLPDGLVSGNFSFNSIAEIPDYYFNLMKHFDSLDFTVNRISKISELTFKGLDKKLSHLNLSSNALSSIPNRVFKEYVVLKTLDLSNNALSSPCNIRTANVEEYSLANNEIKKITDRCFVYSTKVTDLNLSGNEISQIDGGAFTDMTALRELRLDNNQLSEVSEGFDALTGLANFKSLSLAGNNFEYMSSVCNYRFPHIVYIDVSYNRLVDIRQYCFETYSTLSDHEPLELNFEHNEIPSLGDYVFTGLGKRLTRIRLNNNKITTISVATFKSQEVLTSIYLDNNRLTRLDFLRQWPNNKLAELSVANNEITQLYSEDFVHMVSLVKLTLDGNRLVYIQSNAFNGLTALTHLSIKYNLITDLADGAFLGLDSIKSLKLTGNALITLKNCSFGELVTLEQFHFEDNLISCDCDLLWLLQFMSKVKERGMQAAIDKPVLDDDMCQYPESLAGEHMQNKVSELCTTHESDACFGLRTIVEEWVNSLANVSYRWDNVAAGSTVKQIHIEQTEVKTGNVVYNDSASTADSPQQRTLEGFKDGNIFKVCTTVVLADNRKQKSCAVWPTMIKKPTTPAPLSLVTTPQGMHPGSQAAIALAIILIILIILLVLIAVYLWKTKKYVHVIPERFSNKSSPDSSSIEKSPESNGKGDPLDFRPADEKDPMMTQPQYKEHDL